MGGKYEVLSWRAQGKGVRWVSYYQGNNIFLAIYWLLKLKAAGAAYVKLEWR